MRIKEPIRRISWPPPGAADPDALVTREWLVTNGLGGYASGTVAGVITRRYHGVLIAALPAPFGRTVMLSHVAEQLRFADGRCYEFGGRERTGAAPDAHGTGYLVEFRLEAGLPVWRYDVEGTVIEKRVFLPHMQNTVHVMYERLSGSKQAELHLRPAVNFRAQELPVSEPLGWPYEFRAVGDRSEISLAGSQLPPLRLKWLGAEATFTLDSKRIDNVLYPVEESRGYQARGDLWSPGAFSLALTEGTRATLVASTESPETMNVLEPTIALDAERSRRERLLAQAPAVAREGPAAELVLAADQFIITPAGRTEEIARARAYGDEVRTVIAGYHWFTDWGRDTMISLEGLTLTTGRHAEAGYILRTFAHYVRDGLIPNMFPEGEREGLYHTADATLWFFHAVNRYVEASGDRLTLARLYPTLKDIIIRHVQGTAFGIHVDPADGLARAGGAGLSAHVDGREGGRLGRHAAARQSRRDQRALVQRAEVDGGVGEGARRSRRDVSRSCRTGAPVVQRALLVPRRRLSLRRHRRRGRPHRPEVPAQPDFRDRAAASGVAGASMGAGDARRPRSAGDARRPAIAGAGRPGIQVAATSAISARAMPLITRARSGHGWPGRTSMPG